MKKLYLMLVICCFWIAGEAGEPQCYRYLADHFFDDEKAIMQALSLHRITESSWTPIVHDLQRQSQRILPLVKEGARRLENNPLEPYQPEAAEQLLATTLLEVFTGILYSYRVTNSSDIGEMFNYIKSKHQAWQACFRAES